MIDPLIQSCQLSASKLSAPDMAAYITNCLYTLCTVLCVYEYTEQKLELCKAQIEAHLSTLVSEQCSVLLGSLNMGSLYKMCEDPSLVINGSASALPGYDSMAVQTFASKFEEFLAKPDLMTIPQVRKLRASDS